MNAWITLLIAGVLEIAWVSLYSRAFTDNHFITAATIALMVGSFYGLSIAMRTIPTGTAYAVWVGIGAGGAALVGMLFMKEPFTLMRVVCLVAIIGGAAGLKLSSR